MQRFPVLFSLAAPLSGIRKLAAFAASTLEIIDTRTEDLLQGSVACLICRETISFHLWSNPAAPRLKNERLIASMSLILWAWCINVRRHCSLVTNVYLVAGKLRKLSILKVDQNRLSRLTPTIGQCSNITELMLTENLLSELPSSLGNLQKMTTLNIDRNQLETLPVEVKTEGESF